MSKAIFTIPTSEPGIHQAAEPPVDQKALAEETACSPAIPVAKARVRRGAQFGPPSASVSPGEVQTVVVNTRPAKKRAA